MKCKTSFFLMMIFLITFSGALAQRPSFNKNKDILIACFDIRPDPDDIHAVAALGSMLAHQDLSGVNYFAVAGAYGNQGGRYLQSNSLFNMAFGNNWTDAHNNRSAAIAAITGRVTPILKNGGKVWVQEGGQSDVTADWLIPLINANNGISSSTTKNNVILVQHDDAFNEGKANQSKLRNVKANTRYFLLDDGNAGWNDGWGNHGPWSTPMYRNRSNSFVDKAKSSPNTVAKALWTEADRIFNTYFPNGFPHNWSFFFTDGVDYSDCVENWWIFEIGSNADTHAKFWSRYVMNTTGSNPDPDPDPTPISNCNSAPAGLAVSNVADTSITVTYSNTSSDTRTFELRAFPQGTYSGSLSGATSFAAGTKGSNSITINNLQKKTAYDLVLRALCAGGSPGASQVATTTGTTSGDSTPDPDPTPGTSKTVNLSAIDDAYLQGNTRFNSSILRTENGNRVSYLKFDVSGINGSITSANLKLTVSGDSGKGNIEVNVGNNSNWTETNLSTNNAPSKGSLLGNLNKTYSLNQAQNFALSNLIVNGNFLSLIVTQTGGNDVSFASDENSTGKPVLTITYDPPNRAKTILTETKIAIYPNPAINELQILGTDTESNLSIKDLSGRTVVPETKTIGKSMKLDISHLQDGMYLVTVKNTTENKTIRFIKK